jgi:hypothetical protein
MATFTMTHELDCDCARFWELFFDREFSAKMFEALGFPKWEIVEQRDEEHEIFRVVRATPKLEAPGPVAKLLGPGFSYTEEGRFDRTEKVFRFAIKPSVLEGKLRNEGTVRCEELRPGPDGKCRRIVDVVVEAKVFGVGGMLESTTEKSFRKGWGEGADFINRWLDDQRDRP